MQRSILAVCGILAPIIFLVAILGFAAVRPDYSHATNAVSELGVVGAPNGLAWNLIGFILVGGLITCFAAGLHQGIHPVERSKVGPILIGLSGLGFAAAGIFPADMENLSSFSTTMHIVTSTISFFAFIPGTFFMARRMMHDPAWRAMAVVSIVLGLLAIGTMGLRASDVPPGLSQRASFGVYLLWVEIMAIRLLLVQKSAHSLSPS
jgi:hypothetical membrane protein